MYIKVRVTAGAGKELFQKIADDHFEIAVKQKAEGNRANEKVMELLRLHFGKAFQKIRLVSGHHSPSKIFSVE
jgi:uncharacterized protein YggU (UPF0235/DUF167 family)